MNIAEQYFQSITRLGLNTKGAADFFEVDPSTSRRWISGESPIHPAVMMLLAVMLKLDLTPEQVTAIYKKVALQTVDG